MMSVHSRKLTSQLQTPNICEYRHNILHTCSLFCKMRKEHKLHTAFRRSGIAIKSSLSLQAVNRTRACASSKQSALLALYALKLALVAKMCSNTTPTAVLEIQSSSYHCSRMLLDLLVRGATLTLLADTISSNSLRGWPAFLVACVPVQV